MEGIEQIAQTSIAPLQVIYARLDHLEQEINVLKRLVVCYATASKAEATPLGGLARGSVVNEEDFAEAKSWVFGKLRSIGEEV